MRSLSATVERVFSSAPAGTARPRPASRQPSPGRLVALDWLCLSLVIVVLFAVAAAHSRIRLLWGDELLGYQLLSDPSLTHALHAWALGADGGGFFFYVLGHAWLRLFGASALSLRWFSTAGMAAAVVLLWLALRRYFSSAITALSLGIVFLTPPAMLWQELNGRFYGMYFAFAAWAALLFLRSVDAQKPSRTLLAATALAHAGLCGSHTFGFVVSVCLVASLGAADLLRHRWRPALYLAAASGWIITLFSIPAIRASAAVAQGGFWTQRPNLAALLYVFSGDGRLTAALLAGILLAAGFRLLLQRGSAGSSQNITASRMFAPSMLVGSLSAMALFFFVKSQWGTSIFADRYLLPVLIASAILLASALSFLLSPTIPAGGQPVRAWLLALGTLVPLSLFAAGRDTNHALYPHQDFVDRIRRIAPPGIPVVATIPEFLLLRHNAPQLPTRYPLTWSEESLPTQPEDHSMERLMTRWKRAGYDAQEIQSCRQLFEENPKLTLIVGPQLAPWFREHILPNPEFQLQSLGTVDEWAPSVIWSVTRVRPGPAPC